MGVHVFNSVEAWMEESLRFACDVQGVIAMRLLRLAQGGPDAAAEAELMVAEKLEAITDAEVAMLRALCDGEGILVAAERAYAPVRERVCANSSRLAQLAA